MANGIDWFRWHHGSVNDPKFGLVAKKAGARVGDVIAVWALVLETASANTDRGQCGDLDHEATDFLLGAEDGTTARILAAMEDRGLTHNGHVVRWEDRQPKRERVDATAAERKRAQRERDKAPSGDEEDVTPRHTTSHQVTPREEKRREEEKPLVAAATEGGSDGQSSKGGKRSKPSPTEKDHEVARWLFDAQRKANPSAREPNWFGWANDVRLLREVDGRSHKEICELFRWAKADLFWSPNIQSPGKLREKWDTLTERRARDAPSGLPRCDLKDVI